MEKKFKYLAKNTAIFAISSLGKKVIVFLLVPLYTNILSTKDYGLADIIITSSFLLSHFFTLDIADGVLRFAIERQNEQKRILSYGIRVVISGSAILICAIIAFYFTNLISWDRFCYVFLFLDFFALSINKVISCYLRAVDKIKEVAIAGIIETSTTVLLNIVLLLWIKTGILGYLISIVSGSATSAVYCFFAAGISPKKLLFSKCNSQTKREICFYSIPLVLNGIAWWINNSIDKYFVIYILGPAENGILAISYKIPTILMLFHTVFAQAWNLSAIKEYNRNDKDGFFSKIYSTYNAGLVILCSFLILINIPLAKVLFAKEFFIAWKCSSIFVISVLFSSLSGIIGSIFAAVKASRFLAFSTVSSAIVNVVLNYFLIKSIGVIGAAIATAISYIFVWMMRLIFTRRLIKLKINIGKDIICYLLLSLQVLFEHAEKHLYYAQILIFISLIILNKSFITSAFLQAKRVYDTFIQQEKQKQA